NIARRPGTAIRLPYGPHPIVEVSKKFLRSIIRAVVNHDDLKIRESLPPNGRERARQQLNAIMGGNNNGKTHGVPVSLLQYFQLTLPGTACRGVPDFTEKTKQ